MEALFHYTWKHRLFPLRQLLTTDGREVEVIDVGLHNTDAGPDFFNAKLKIGGEMWVGNVELHIRSSQWYQHHHDTDPAYDNVILHVVCEADREVFNSQGEKLTQMVLAIPEWLRQNYERLLVEDRYPRCHKIIPTLPALTIHAWMSALQTERLERKTNDILRLLDAMCGSWEDAYFQTLARYYGFGVNNEAFARLGSIMPLRAVDHHRDDIFQVEALFMGMSGLLDINALPRSHREDAANDEYFQRIQSEYKYLAYKFSLTPMDGHQWNFLRLRPQNFPYIRISQLAQLYYSRKANFRDVVECKTLAELKETLSTQVTEYWQTHYVFGVESEKNEKHMSDSSLEVLIINAIVPLLFAYGRYKHNDDLVDRSLDILEELKPENNNIVRLWRECGLTVANAGDSQALIQLKKEYCDRKDCLRCRFGYHFMKAKM